MPIQTIIFDFDYTLVDSARGTIDGVNYAFEKNGFTDRFRCRGASDNWFVATGYTAQR